MAIVEMIVVEKILGIRTERFVPKIQEEVVRGMKLSETEAGSFINEALVKLQRKHEEEKKALREEFDLARRERESHRSAISGLVDANWRVLEKLKLEEALLKQGKLLDEKIKKREEEQRKMSMSEMELMKERIRELEIQGKDRIVPPNPIRFWHLRWRCIGCKDAKTDFEGEWTCPKCHVTQDNCQ